MNSDKMHLINKIFSNEIVRTVWDKEEEKYYISVVDVVGIISESNDGRKYWNKLKQRLNEEGNETVTNCHQLKLKAKDGKYRLTDVVDIEGMFRIIESIPSKNAEPIKQWLAKLGSERIDEVFDPSITVQRAIDTYRAKGYKEYKGLRKESLRDNMSDLEVALADIGEIATRELTKEKKPIGLEENKKVAKIGGHTAKVTRDYLEEQLGKSVITNENNLDYKYIDNNKELIDK